MRRWILTLTTLIAASSSYGQDAGVWVGHKVVLFEGTPLKVGRREVKVDYVLRPYRVKYAKDGWLWLDGKDASGWVPANRVIQYEQAIAYHDQILQNDSQATWALARRAALWREREEYKNAEADYLEYIRLRPEDSLGHAGLGRVLLDQEAYPEAVAEFTQAIQLNPTDTLAYLERGRARMIVQSYDSAITDFTTVIELSPGDVHAYCRRSVAYSGLHKLDEALADANEAVRIDATFKRGYPFETRGMAHLAKHDLANALADFSENIRLNPMDCHLYNIRACVRMAIEDYDAAIADFDETIRLDPTGLAGQAYSSRAGAYFIKKDYPRVFADCDQSIRLGSTNPMLFMFYQNRGTMRAWRKNYDGALADLTEAIRLNPGSAHAYCYRGNVHWSRSHFDQALAEYDTAFKIAPDDPEVLGAKAWLHAACPDPKFRDGALAVALATRACERTKWQDGKYLQTLAMAYAETGDFDKAVEWQQKVVDQSKPDDDKDALEGRIALFRRHEPFRDTENVRYR